MENLKISKTQIQIALCARSRALRNWGDNNKFEDSLERRWKIGRGYILFDGFLKPINTSYSIDENTPNIKCFEHSNYTNYVKGHNSEKLSREQVIELCFIDSYIATATGIYIDDFTIDKMVTDFNEYK